jgi:hypothetical protein
MPGDTYQRFRDADTREARIRVSRDAVQDNPLLVDYHFYRRFQLFKRQVLALKFNIVNQWDRFEWQARGSAHNHGLYWCNGAPANEVEKMITREERDDWAKFWGIHIRAISYEKFPEDVIYNEHSTMSRSLDELENTGAFLNTTTWYSPTVTALRIAFERLRITWCVVSACLEIQLLNHSWLYLRVEASTVGFQNPMMAC